MAVTQGCTWRNHFKRDIEAVFACGEAPCECFLEFEEGFEDLVKPYTPCSNCILVHHSANFQKALNKKRADSETKKFIPDAHIHSKLRQIYKRFKGLESLITEAKISSFYFSLSWISAHDNFDGCTVFKGLVEAMVIGTEREAKGKDTQNMRYALEYDNLTNTIHDMSPCVYRMLSGHLKLRSERSIQDKNSKASRFPIGIKDSTFKLVSEYCEKYNWPKGYPLALAVNDTKLFATLAPIFDSESRIWRLVGAVTITPLQQRYAAIVFCSKCNLMLRIQVRLWALQIPIPGIPSLILAVLPISSTYKAPQLAEYQSTLLQGLISRGYGVILMAADGAAVERDCQQCCASAVAKEEKSTICYLDSSNKDLIVSYYSLNGQFFTLAQDSLHLQKTARNNSFTGARLLILGDFVVHYCQIHDLALKPNSPLYHRDVIKYDKQDDNAAGRMFSSRFLEHSSQDPMTNMGLIVYLFVFGELVDAFQSRNMAHRDQATIAIRTILFLQTWRKFLAKMGYSEKCHFISAAAYDICITCTNSLLALMFIHHDCLPQKLLLIPHKHITEFIEHVFAEMRKLILDFNMQQTLLCVPKL
ncbi:hypothetical protein BT96DRAFT_817314, partial [Gymnopus androsaceus JB14]